MSNKRAASSRATETTRAQLDGARKDEFIRGILQDLPDLNDELASQVAEHLCSAIDVIRADRSLVEYHLKPKPMKPKAFDPNGFSLLKVYRTSGERGLREKLREVEESSHLQALAKAQHISVPSRLRADGADAAALKEAIVKGVIGRHEDWQAAS
jgi:hypothetical protein